MAAAVDYVSDDLGQSAACSSGGVAQGGERGAHVESQPLREHAFRLLDQDAAV